MAERFAEARAARLLDHAAQSASRIARCEMRRSAPHERARRCAKAGVPARCGRCRPATGCSCALRARRRRARRSLRPRRSPTARARFGNGAIDLSARANLQLRGVSEATLPALHARLDDARPASTPTPRPSACATSSPVRSPTSIPTRSLDVAADRRGAGGAARERRALARAAGQVRLRRRRRRRSAARRRRGGHALRRRRATDALRCVTLAGDDGAGRALRADETADVAARLALAFLALARRWRRRAAPDARRWSRATGAAPSSRRRRPCAPTPTPRVAASRVAARLCSARTRSARRPFVGAALPFGRIDAADLRALARARARRLGASGLRLTPWRAFLVAGLDARGAANRCATPLAALGFILDPDDPRLAVAACPGAPACAQRARRRVQRRRARLARCAAAAGDGVALHVSGCAKGCAHRRAAPLTLVARDRAATISSSTARAGDAPVASRAFDGRGRVAARRDREESPLDGRVRLHPRRRRDLSALLRDHPRARPISRASRPPRSASRCASSMPAAWSRRPPTSSSRPAPRRRRDRGAASAARRSSATREMVADGVTRARLPADNDVICTLGDPAVAGARREARHDALGGGARSLGRAARRRRGRDRQRADGAVPSARNARGRRADAGRDHRHAGRLRRRGGIEGGADRERLAGASSCAGARRQRDGGGGRQCAGERRRNERVPAVSMASASAPAIPNCSPSRRRGCIERCARRRLFRQGRAARQRARDRRPLASRRPHEELPLYYPDDDGDCRSTIPTIVATLARFYEEATAAHRGASRGGPRRRAARARAIRCSTARSCISSCG